MAQIDRGSLIAAYAEGAKLLEEAWRNTPATARKWKPAADAWSAHEIVVHCADSETMAASRIRLLISDPNPILPGYDQDEWVDIFRYHDRDPELALAVIAAVRANTVPVLQAMPDAVWSATGTHTQSGRYSAEEWLQNYAAHLHEHVQQIENNLRLFQEHHA